MPSCTRSLFGCCCTGRRLLELRPGARTDNSCNRGLVALAVLSIASLFTLAVRARMPRRRLGATRCATDGVRQLRPWIDAGSAVAARSPNRSLAVTPPTWRNMALVVAVQTTETASASQSRSPLSLRISPSAASIQDVLYLEQVECCRPSKLLCVMSQA